MKQLSKCVSSRETFQDIFIKWLDITLNSITERQKQSCSNAIGFDFSIFCYSRTNALLHVWASGWVQWTKPTIKSVMGDHSDHSRSRKATMCFVPAIHQKKHWASLQTITVQDRLTSTFCAQFIGTVSYSLAEHWFPWPPGADFSTTALFGCCKGNQICLPSTLSLSPALGRVHLSTLTACGTQRGMKWERPPPPIYILLSEEIYTISISKWNWSRVTKILYSYNVTLWDYFKGT